MKRSFLHASDRRGFPHAGPSLSNPRLGQRVDSQRAAEVRVGLQASVVADCTEAVRRLVEASGETDTGPATNARVEADELLALVSIA